MFWFCFAWILWCVMHSLCITPGVATYIKKRMGDQARYYRLLYNIVSIASLLPLLMASLYDRGTAVFSWSGEMIVIRFILLGLAGYCFFAGAQGYNMHYFLGLQQVRDGKDHLLLGDGQSFIESGILGIIRHPWYLGSLLFIWSVNGVYYQKNVAVAVILTMYLLVGVMLEERKILAEYGDSYRDYQKRVSMIVPIKWLRRRLKSG